MPFENLKGEMNQNGFEMQEILLEHLQVIADFPLYHQDPFDRLLIAQGKRENLTIITKDSFFQVYEIKTFW